jgi:hypothetical protein
MPEVSAVATTPPGNVIVVLLAMRMKGRMQELELRMDLGI